MPEELPVFDKKRQEVEQEIEDEEMKKYMKNLRERSRRTVIRGMEKGTINWDP